MDPDKRLEQQIKTVHWLYKALSWERHVRRMYQRCVLRPNLPSCPHRLFREYRLEKPYVLFECRTCGYKELNTAGVQDA